MARKLKLKWNSAPDNKGAFAIKGREMGRETIQPAGHLIQWVARDGMLYSNMQIDTYLTTGGGDTWMCRGFKYGDSVMSSFSKYPNDWTLLHCPSGEERSWF